MTRLIIFIPDFKKKFIFYFQVILELEFLVCMPTHDGAMLRSINDASMLNVLDTFLTSWIFVDFDEMTFHLTSEVSKLYLCFTEVSILW